MTVGNYAFKGDVDAKAGQLCQRLRETLTEIADFKTWLDTQTDQNLIDKYGYIQADIDNMKSAFTDQVQLRQVYLGVETRSPAYDYRTFAKLIG